MNVKRLALFFLVFLATPAIAQMRSANSVLSGVYGPHTIACTATAVDSSNANRATVTRAGLYQIYGYTSSTDFTGIGIKCLQGGATVTVNGVEGVKFSAGEKQVWDFRSGQSMSISCQTGSGSGYYDLCLHLE